MIKRLVSLCLLPAMLFAFTACDNGKLSELDMYKAAAKIEIQEYADGKGQDNYSEDKWAELLNLAADGKQTVDDATNKDEVDATISETKMAINNVEDCKSADFVLTISVDSNTKNYGEDFVVEVTLKNQSGADVSISYYYSPVDPVIKNWEYPHPPLGMPQLNTIVIKDGKNYTKTWSLCHGYMDPVTEKRTPLPVGDHDLFFSVNIVVDQKGVLVRSNTIKLTVK